MKLERKPILFAYLILASTFLSAADQIKPALTGTFIPQNQELTEKSSERSTQDQRTFKGIISENKNSSPTILSILDRDGSEYTFTNCGAFGTEGPTQNQSNSAYIGSNLDGAVTVTDGIQQWIVPATGPYSITAAGASGGYTPNVLGGKGRAITVEVILSQGDIIDILVGHEGGRGQISGNGVYAGGGGGGTYIIKNGLPLLICGGGGGSGEGIGNYSAALPGVDASTYDETDGSDGTGYSGSWNQVGLGGIDGEGGGASSMGGSGGGGYYSNGNSGNYSGIPGEGYVNGGSGGINRIFSGSFTLDIQGGFGGGAGAGLHANFEANGGGGGGYSGGGGSNTRVGSGGGGGNLYTGIFIASDLNTGNGLVVITGASASNSEPTATAQSVAGNEDSPQAITLEGNDVDGDALTYSLLTNASNGTTSLIGNEVTYTPNTNYNGSDSFTFTVSDGELTSAPATVNISIVAVNDTPMATAQSVTGNEDSPQIITLAGSDIDGDPLIFALVTNSLNGTSTLSGNVLTYTSNTNYNGSDSFTFTVSDAGLTSSPATVNITVVPVNDLPVISSTPLIDALDGYTYEYAIDISDIDGDDVLITAITKPDWLAISNNSSSSLSFDGVDDYVYVSNNYNLLPMTVQFSFKGSFSGAHNGIFTTDSPGAYGQSISVHNGKLGVQVQNDFITSNFDIINDTWYNVAAVFNDGIVKLYVNSALAFTQTYTQGDNDNVSGMFLGKYFVGNPYFANVDISHMSIWSKELSQTEIQFYINTLPTGAETDLVSYWKMNESGSTLTDLSGNDNHGTINGATWSTDVSSSSNVLSGTPSLSDGGLHDIVLSADDGNGGVVTQSYTLAVSLHSLEIAGDSGFRMFSSPVSGSIYGDLLDELWTQGAVGSDNPNSNPNIWTFGNNWSAVTDFSSDEVTAGQGFLMYVYADTDFDGVDDLPVTISIDGAQSQSGVSVPSEPSAWNLMGNPYGLSVGINQMLSDNNGTFNSTVYALDLDNPGYKFHNGLVGNIENAEIKPFEGFWVQANENGSTFQFTEQSIRKGSLTNSARTNRDGFSGYAEFTFTNGNYNSTTYLSFTEEGLINLDPADADRLVPMSLAEHLTSMIYESNKSLAINNLPFDLSTDLSMDMDVMMLTPTDDNGYATQAQQVDLTWDISNLPEGISLELTNNITGQNINLNEDLSAVISLPSKGDFAISGDFMGTYPAVGQSQFTLSVYGSTFASVGDDILPARLTLHDAYPNPFNPSTIISFDLINADRVSLEIFDIAGRQVASLLNGYMIPGSHQVNWNPGNLSSGLYLVNLVVGTETFNQKITFIK